MESQTEFAPVFGTCILGKKSIYNILLDSRLIMMECEATQILQSGC
mgnify:CR=1 FL=1